MKIVAALDIGSNSIHLAIAEIDAGGHLTLLDTHKEVVRLGRAIAQAADDSIDRVAMDLAIKTLATMKEICAAYEATIRAVATHATRAASNHEEFLAEIERVTGIHVEIIDGDEEARLTFLGMRCGLPLDNQLVVGVDVGGGSTEIIIAKANRIHFVTSLKVGAVTMTELYFQSGEFSAEGVQRLRAEVMMALAPIVTEARSHKFTLAVASSGTAKALAAMTYMSQTNLQASNINGFRFTEDDIDAIERRLVKLGTPVKIKNFYGVDTKRADIILAGTCILKTVGEMLGIHEWIASDYGLREGLAMDTFSRQHVTAVNFSDIRWKSALACARKYGVAKPSARHVRRLAVAIYRQIEPRFFSGRDDDFREANVQLLQTAAFLAEVGKYVSYSKRHTHSAYILSEGSLLGYSQEEKHLMSYIVRFSRKRIATVEEDARLESIRGNIERVNVLAACLRCAAALNRTRRNHVKRVSFSFAGDSLAINVYYPIGANVEAEQDALQKEGKSLGKVFGAIPMVSWLPLS